MRIVRFGQFARPRAGPVPDRVRAAYPLKGRTRASLITNELRPPSALIATRVLFDNYVEAKKAMDHGAMSLFLVHAVLVLVRAKKSGIALHA